jgi:glycosyltransferase involved in cell wall biosynthesis
VKEEHRILIITESPPRSYNPASERLLGMAIAGASVFDQVILLSLRGSKTQNRETRNAKGNLQALSYAVNFTRALPYPLMALIDPVKLLVFLVHGFILCKRYRFSCIAASMPPLETGASACLLGKLFRVKLVIDLMDDWESVLASQLRQYVPLKLFAPLFRFSGAIYSSSAAILVVTNTLAKRVQARKINAKLILAPNGANTSIFYPRSEDNRKKIRLRHGLPVNKIILTYSGSGGNPYYRLDTVLSSIKSLDPSLKKEIFLVLYLYDAMEYYNELKSQLKLPDSLVEIRKAIPRNSLAEVLAACEIGLVPFDDKPYLQYATSTKLYEYLSAGLLIIGTGPLNGELESLLSMNRALGFFTQPNIKDMVSVMLEVIQNNASISNDGSRKLRHAFISENYDIKKTMTRVMQFLSNSLFD